MKKLFLILFLFTSFLGFGQSVSAPDSKSFLQSTSAQDASGFVLSGFGATSTLLTLVNKQIYIEYWFRFILTSICISISYFFKNIPGLL